MSITLHATPYAFDEAGFYFTSLEDYEQKYEAHLPIEEYEIQFIDGPDEAVNLFKAMTVSQANIGDYFEQWDELEDEPQTLALVCHLMTDHSYCDVSDAREKAKEVSIFEGSVKDYAYDFVESAYFTVDTPSVFKTYFDYDGFARDLEANGDVETLSVGGTTYVVSGV